MAASASAEVKEVTKAWVVGDFESVLHSYAVERFVDVILFAVKGGSVLLPRTQKAYFEKSTAELPYLRLYDK